MEVRALDIRGLLCPVTWARVRRELLTLHDGDRLEVMLDHRPAIPDIRRNAVELGHEIASAEAVGDGEWRVVISVGDELPGPAVGGTSS